MKIFFLASVSLIVFAQIIFGQNNSNGFAIYRLPGAVKSSQLSTLDLKKLKPNGAPLIAESDFRYYQKEIHQFKIEYVAAMCLKKLNSLSGITGKNKIRVVRCGSTSLS